MFYNERNFTLKFLRKMNFVIAQETRIYLKRVPVNIEDGMLRL